ncbi:ATP-binding protein [Saccharopolyspora sp. WRP15-2]|uniref:ATP-binding protein n=1 Tax=Saccharopolyspora oryzae TaxID=2997343 RepID=A0ABT4UZ05_9PSEU|nr:ATP-binding protein [Saccharopolyspora oryzae]MDA3626915.1 ATP-binding protein [Saccharopolyspora oryzae]
MSSNPLLDSLRNAVTAAPEDIALRLHLAELLLSDGARDEAVSHIAAALQQEPGNAAASRMMAQALAPADRTEPEEPEPAPKKSYDWSAAEAELADVVQPRFIESDESEQDDEPEAVPSDPQADGAVFEVETSDVRLDDVGGMTEVKKRLNAAFLAPMRNAKLRKLFGKSLRGGLLLYGPPGCGKTFLAKAVAGELGARFISVTLQEVLDMWMGNSEKNMHALFQTARQNAPCVLFFDEIDAIGQRRSQLRNSGLRGTVNQLLTELDGVKSDNEGVFVLAATNHPWDIDQALLRPGRFDRAVAVLPPDDEARKAILGYHLKDRPVAGIKLSELVKRTDGFSGADLAHICEAASERALMDSIEAGEPRMIEMPDLLGALGEVTPSTTSWFTTARNVVLYSNQDGTYNDLAAYLKKKRML